MAPALPARAVTFVAPRHVELRPVAVDAPRAGQVLVRTSYSGISAGTEMLAYRGELDAGDERDETISSLGGTFDYPFHYGYSCVGRVEHSACDLPVDALVFAFHPHQDVFVAEASDVIPLPALDAREATLFPLVETALQISLDAGHVHEQPVVVQGLGAVGLLTALLLDRAGAIVIGSELLSWRREIAGRLGVRAVHPEDLAAAVEAETNRHGVRLVVEVSGRPDVLAQSLALLAREGTALVASWYGTKPVALPLGGEFHRRRLTIRSTQVSTIPASMSRTWDVSRRRAAAVGLLAELPVGALATHDYAFDAAPEAYAAVHRAEPGLLHAALRYD